MSAGTWAQPQQGWTQGSPPERQTLGQLTCCTLGSHVTTGHSGASQCGCFGQSTLAPCELPFHSHQTVFKNLEVHCITVLLMDMHMISQKEKWAPAPSPIPPRPYFPLYWGQRSEGALLKTDAYSSCPWGPRSNASASSPHCQGTCRGPGRMHHFQPSHSSDR